MPTDGLPLDVVAAVLESEFECDVSEPETNAEGDRFIIVRRAGALFVSVLQVMPHEVMRFSLQITARELALEYDDVLVAILNEIQHRLDNPVD